MEDKMEDKANSTLPSNNNLVNSLKVSSSSIATSRLIIALLVVIILGAGTGYIFSRIGSTNNLTGAKESVSTSSEESKQIVGSADTKTFKDTATGTLKIGGIDGEGAYHLVRPGGASQNVYITSSIVDLSVFVGKNIKVWGQTQKAQTAGWLMDVGRIEVSK